ncbi:MAG: hypothetical protein LBS63_04305, partial [Prevotellaceae bacterium]|nr:hypothetical protein [Prevotellaceae bacterium]
SDEEQVRAYLRLGLGVPIASLLDAYVGKDRGERLLWNAYASHYGSYGAVKNTASDDVPTLDMRNDVGATVQYNFESALLYANLGFRQHSVRFYGYDPDSFRLDDYKALGEEQVRQHFNHTYANLSYRSKGFPDQTWSYAASFGYYNHSSRTKQAENALSFNLSASKEVEDVATFALAASADAYLRSEQLAERNNVIVSVKPQATRRQDWWEATAKLNLTFDNADGAVKTYLYPTLGFTAFVLEDAFVPFAEISGGHEANTYAAITDLNPYLAPDTAPTLRSSRSTFQIKGGVRGMLSSMLGYKVALEYAFVNDMLFFAAAQRPDGLGSYFDALYDNVTRFTLDGNLYFRPAREAEIRYALRYDAYGMDKLPKPYGRPALSMALEGAYNLWNKLGLQASLNLYGGYAALGYDGRPLERPLGVDLSLGASYSFFDRSSVFLRASNLLASRYHLYSGYPSYGFNLLVGYSCIF